MIASNVMDDSPDSRTLQRQNIIFVQDDTVTTSQHTRRFHVYFLDYCRVDYFAFMHHTEYGRTVYTRIHGIYRYLYTVLYVYWYIPYIL